MKLHFAQNSSCQFYLPCICDKDGAMQEFWWKVGTGVEVGCQRERLSFFKEEKVQLKKLNRMLPTVWPIWSRLD